MTAKKRIEKLDAILAAGVLRLHRRTDDGQSALMLVSAHLRHVDGTKGDLRR